METLQDDPIKRRAAEVSEWLHSAIDIPDSPFGTPPPHGESTHKIHFGISDAFAKSIREEDYHKYYEPRVVSIGPFHHGKPHLAPMENFKRQAVRELALWIDVSIEQVYATVEQDLLRIAKECYDVSRWDGISDPEWCLMMFLDGCFVIVFLSYYFDIEVPSHEASVSVNIMKNHDIEPVHRDLLLLENQFPSKVLRVLEGALGVEQIFKSERLSSLFLQMPLMIFSVRQASKLVDCVHLLQSCRDILVGDSFKEEKKDVYPSFSVTELKKVGIRCSYAMDRRDYSLTDIHFESSILAGHLFLPQLNINEWTVTLFSNLLAYEDSCSMLRESAEISLRESAAISSYLSFMCMLINGEEDVKELQARGILNVNFKDDEKLINFLRDMTAHIQSDHKGIRRVKKRISAYRKSKRLPLRIAYAELKQRYFSGPWSFLVFLAVIFTVSMTVIQTVLTGIQTYK